MAIAGLTRVIKAVTDVEVLAPALINLVPPLAISPEEVEPGDTVRITAILRNDGDEQGLTDVILRIRGQVEETREDRVIPGQQEVRLSFEVTRQELGAYSVEIEAPGATDVKLVEGEFTVITPKVARLVAVPGTLRVEPDTVTSGESVTISIDVKNEGDAIGTRTIPLLVDGVEVGDRRITIEAADTVTVTFTHVELVPGSHSVEVDGEVAQFTVVEAAEAAAFPIIIIIVVVVVVLLLGGVGAFLFFRSRKGGAAT